jgi:hypothetical protein
MASVAPGAYVGELRTHSRTLAAPSLGFVWARQLTDNRASLSGPYLLHSFDSSKAQLSRRGSNAEQRVERRSRQ